MLRALLDEREKRQDVARQLERYQTQERERQKAAEDGRAPLSDRLFTDPDTTIAEITRNITGPLEARIESMRVQHDFALAGVRHKEVFADAWAAWFSKVGSGQDADTYFAVMKAPSPGEALVQWYRGEQRNTTIGDDLDAYNARIIREAFEARGLPVPEDLGGQPGQQRPEQRFDATRTGAPSRDPSGRFTSSPQAPRLPTATSRMGQSGGGLNDRDEDGSDGAIFDSGRPERGRAR
jgi:hypothetical protein